MAVAKHSEDGRSARMPAAQRREEILEAARIEFARGGLNGTATEDIARRAGITQPYVFRLFGTKKALYLETVERCFDRIQREFDAAVEDGRAGRGADGDGRWPTARCCATAPCCWARCTATPTAPTPTCRRSSNAATASSGSGSSRRRAPRPQEVREFFAKGMLLNVIAAIDLRGLRDPWVADCLGEMDPNA